MRRVRIANKNENRPIRDVDHPRKYLNEMCPRPRGRSDRYAIEIGMNVFDGLVIFCLQGGVVIHDGHYRRSRTSLKMLFPSFGVAQKPRSQKDCFIVENWMIVTDDRTCKPYTCSTSGAAPPASGEIVGLPRFQRRRLRTNLPI